MGIARKVNRTVIATDRNGNILVFNPLTDFSPCMAEFLKAAVRY
jgi:hypothetical protein